MSGPWSDAWHNIVTFLPKFVAFIVILVVGWFVAKLIGKAVDAVLERLHFDRAVERGGIKKALAASQYDASTIVGKLVFYTLVLFVLQLAFAVFGPNPITDLLTGVIAFLPKVLVAIVIVVITAAIASVVRDLITNTLGGLSYGRTLANIAAAFIIGIGIIAALNQIGIATTVTTPILIAVLTAIVGVIVVGVGGGLVKPMQARWESYLTKAEQEAPRIRREAANASAAQESAAALSRPEPQYAVDAHYAPSTEVFEPIERPAQEPTHTSASQPGASDASQPYPAESHPYDSYTSDSYAAGSYASDSGSSSERPDSQDPYASQPSYDSHGSYDSYDTTPHEASREPSREESDSYAAERRDGDTRAFERPPVDTQIFGDEEQGRSGY